MFNTNRAAVLHAAVGDARVLVVLRGAWEGSKYVDNGTCVCRSHYTYVMKCHAAPNRHPRAVAY